MALTAQVKDELLRTRVRHFSSRKAEVVTVLRFCEALGVVTGSIVVQAEVESKLLARRLQSEIYELFGHQAQIGMMSSGRTKRGQAYTVRIHKGGAALARQTELLDMRGKAVKGLPTTLVNGSLADACAVWRGAFMVNGTLSEPGRSVALEIATPCSEVALALVGAGRRLGIIAKAREVRGVNRVVLRDSEAIGNLLEHMGAYSTLKVWEERRAQREVRGNANRQANFDDANLRRSARAAVAAAARVERAFEILGDDIPEHLRYAGMLRLQYKQVSLEELGQAAQPPLTKDAIAGRIRRLLATANKIAEERGIPGTDANLTPEMLEDI